MQNNTWDPAFEENRIKLIDKDILPEIQKIQDSLQSSYEKMFGGVIKKSGAMITPTLLASFWVGLSSGQILSLSCAAVAGALTIALPEIVNVWENRKETSRNALSFLLHFEKE